MNWLSELDNALSQLFSYFGEMRNDAGPPTGGGNQPRDGHGEPYAVPHYLRNICDLMEGLDARKPLWSHLP